jgi:hypothetical protein
VLVGVAGGDLDFEVESGGARELVEAEEREEKPVPTAT